ncbi:DNA replication licensing factor MCM3 [Pelomyxa schiedti]|nr:DNA replication licensing factor MCM3 [Pelomyxa schiedti]
MSNFGSSPTSSTSSASPSGLDPRALYLQQTFTNFLDWKPDGGVNYQDKVQHMLLAKEKRLLVDLRDLKVFDPVLAEGVASTPYEHIPHLQTALTKFVARIRSSDDDSLLGGVSSTGDDGSNAKATAHLPASVRKQDEYFLGFTGSSIIESQGRRLTPRDLSSHLLRRLICVEGILTKCSFVRPKLVRSVHYVENTHRPLVRNYMDETSVTGEMSLMVLPSKDTKGNPAVIEYGLCTFKDVQTAVLQETPESAPPGQLPRSVAVIFNGDLVDRVKPGDRVQIVGVYRALVAERMTFRTVLIAHSIEKAHEGQTPEMSEEDILNIKAVSKQSNILEQLGASLAPSIWGHDTIKKAMILQLMGGQEKTLKDNMHLRGDIHVLLVGDPSTAKSQMLRIMLSVAPLAISTNGRGATGVGLTAAVMSDPDTGERILEAGAMVLADRGVVCIDEFDKMSIDDRAAMHEVMEQQTVTIQKAGIHTSLNAHCSVFAAANPVYGTYNRDKSVVQNICFPDSLLSRFDLLFIVLDSTTDEQDRNIAKHVLGVHQYRRGEEFDDDASADSFSDNTGFSGAHSGCNYRTTTGLLTLDFVRKYILYAKHCVRPNLSPDVCSTLTNAYAELRSPDTQGNSPTTLPITARTLDSLIRLSEAHARCRLSKIVEEADVQAALTLMHQSLHNEQQNNAYSTLQPQSTTLQEQQQIDTRALISEVEKTILQSLRISDQISAQEVVELVAQARSTHKSSTTTPPLDVAFVVKVMQQMEKANKVDYEDEVAFRKCG